MATISMNEVERACEEFNFMMNQESHTQLYLTNEELADLFPELRDESLTPPTTTTVHPPFQQQHQPLAVRAQPLPGLPAYYFAPDPFTTAANANERLQEHTPAASPSANVSGSGSRCKLSKAAYAERRKAQKNDSQRRIRAAKKTSSS